MQVRNVSNLVAAAIPGRRADGRELLVAIVKATYTIAADGTLSLAPEQEPLAVTDVFAGEPGLSPPLYEADVAPLKPRCDLVVVGFAHAPGGAPCTVCDVRLQIGQLDKTIRVVGDRTWRRGLFGVKANDPLPFTTMPLSWDRAWGGMDASHPKPKHHRYIPENPLGRGLHTNTAKEAVEGKPLPNLEVPGQPVAKPDGDYRAVCLGVVARNMHPRLAHAGTYDQKWQDELAPFPPDDFRDDFHQYAPADQQIPYPQGGERLTLTNCTPDGTLAFDLPRQHLPVNVHRHNHEDDDLTAVLDTVVIRPDTRTVICLWRTHALIRRNLTEVKEVVIGAMSPSYFRARRLGKQWYPSAAALIDSRRKDDAA